MERPISGLQGMFNYISSCLNTPNLPLCLFLNRVEKTSKEDWQEFGQSSSRRLSRPFSSLLGFSAGARERAKSIVKPSPVRTVTGNPTSLIPNDPSSVTPLDFTNTLSGFSLPPPATSGSKPAVENIVANDKAKNYICAIKQPNLTI